MEKIPILHIRPFIVSGLIALLSAGAIIYGLYRMQVIGDFDAPGIILIGGFLLLTALVIAIVYGLQEKLFRKTMRQPLMAYSLDAVWLQESIAKNAAEISGQNKLMLFVMLFFCLLLAIIFLFVGEDGPTVSLVMLGLAAFLSISAWIITRYRIRKLRKGGSHVLIGLDGVLFLGQFHTWALPGGRLDQFSYDPPQSDGDSAGVLNLVYSLPGRYSRTRATLQVFVPPELDAQARQTLQRLRQKHEKRRPTSDK